MSGHGIRRRAAVIVVCLLPTGFVGGCSSRSVAQVQTDGPLPDLLLPDQSTVPDLEQVKSQWTKVSPGTFLMGSPPNEPCRAFDESQHQVTLTHGFEIWSTEVTQDQFTELMGYNPSRFSACGPCPVENVTWYEATRYCNRLSDQAGLNRCYNCPGEPCHSGSYYPIYECPGYRLPTESEWEYACRAGAIAAYYLGPIASCIDSDPVADKIGWYHANAKTGPKPVARKQPNAWGLYDMAGNVWEWCHDGYFAFLGSGPETDPVGSGSHEVYRGGSWANSPGQLRCAVRNYAIPKSHFGTIGFRCVRSDLSAP